MLPLLLLCCTLSWARQQNISGIVKGPDGAIAKVSVREVDANHRILSHTTTDRNGLFTFQVRDASRHSLQFYAPGYRTITHKIHGETLFKVTLEKRRTSPYADKAKFIINSEHLFCGHYRGEIVRCKAWIEKMCDTLYAIILPVEMERPVDEYPSGRRLIVLDELDREVMTLENVVDVYPISGEPDEVRTVCIAQSYTGAGYMPGISDGKRFYAYPHFQISRTQLEQLCQRPESLCRVAVDTYNGTDWWNFFPRDKTFELFRKVLDEM